MRHSGSIDNTKEILQIVSPDELGVSNKKISAWKTLDRRRTH
ncbi:hypothetical protein CHCC20335_1639 [Bacillus paralicheniformis]|nr:hypothetical protein CHCC20335_1639 [Bacillus paralicheniformis]